MIRCQQLTLTKKNDKIISIITVKKLKIYNLENKMNTILGEIGKSKEFVKLINEIENKKSPIAISGLNSVGMTQIQTGIHEFTKKPLFIIT